MEIFPGENPTKSNVIVSLSVWLLKKRKRKKERLKKKERHRDTSSGPLKKERKKKKILGDGRVARPTALRHNEVVRL